MVRPSALDPPELSRRLWEGVRGATGWDIGANCGQSIPEMARRFDRLFSFEPCGDSFQAAKRVAAEFSNVTVIQTAISDHDGLTALAMLPGEQVETGQYVTPGVEGMEWSPPDWGAVPTDLLPCLKVDSIVAGAGAGRPSFLKVDTEGHEVAVLEGANQLIWKDKLERHWREPAHWLIEFHTPQNRVECLSLLMEAGYQTETIRHPHYEPGSDMWHQHGWLKTKPGQHR